MKRPIEIMVDVPDHVDCELLELLLYLSDSEINLVKGIVTGILMADGNISTEQLNAIRAKHKK